MNGLVLIGGKSKRMGKPKGDLIYHDNLPQQYYIYNILKKLCDTVYLSCRKHQVQTLDSSYAFICDMYDDIGPLGGVLSAFHHNPNTEWLVVACDMPYLNYDVLYHLTKATNSTKCATTYKNEDRIEPLCTIWSPKSYTSLQTAYTNKIYSLTKILRTIPVEYIPLENSQDLANINTPKEHNDVLKQLNQ